MKNYKTLSIFFVLIILLNFIVIYPIKSDAREMLENNEFQYTVNDDGTAEILRYLGSNKDVVIPSVIDGCNVTKIAPFSFTVNANLLSVTIPDSVETIDHHAFQNLKKLNEVVIGDNVKAIADHAFFQCPELKNITIPKNVESIGDYAFGYTDSNGGFVISFTVFGYSGSAAEDYALGNRFLFKSLGTVVEPTEPTEPQPSKTEISKWNVSGIKNKTYTGRVIKQDNIIVSKDGEYADFSVKYKNNLNVGTATVTITGTGDYTGTIVKTFKITKAANPLTVKVTTKTVKLAAVKKKAQTVKAITVSKAQGKVSYKLTSVPKALKKFVKINSKGVITISKWAKAKKGIYKITLSIKASGNSSYNAKTTTQTLNLRIK